jgi:leucine carboxyl methyltransferase
MATISSLAEPSRTAVLTAAARALHRDEPPPWVLDDPLAAGLAGPDGTVMMARLRAELPAPGLLAFVRWVCVRSRFAEDTVEEAASCGIGQYVSLFTPGEAEQLLRGHGFGAVTHFGPGEALATYFSGRTDVRLGGAQRLIAATVT